ncbi:MAG: response regulator [Lentisphaeria bacterium]|nr:response regulator [Lentisphaeria bacterium]
MSDLELYLGKDLPDNERFRNTRAYLKGSQNGLQFFLTRMNRYFDLLEFELEDNPAAEVYLKESTKALKRALDFCILPNELNRLKEDFENFDLSILLEGVCKRLNSISDHSVHFENTITNADEQSSFVSGIFYMLQQVLMEMPQVLDLSKDYSFNLTKEYLEKEFFLSRKVELNEGDYFQVYIQAKETDLNAYTTLMEALIQTPDLQIDESYILLYGTLLEHGGELLIPTNGQLDEGMVLLLPVMDNKAHMFDDITADDDLSGTETILLVDDEGIILDVVIDMLQSLGYTVVLAQNGQECVDIFKANPGVIDLVLLDMVMPELNGHEAFFQMKEFDPKVKVLLQSGYIAQKEAQEVLESGALGFLQKPYRMNQLAKKLRQVFGS